MEVRKWVLEAACAGTDSETFFFDDPESNEAAKAICATCPVRAQCLSDNMNEPHGVFGGTTPEERRILGGGLGGTVYEVELYLTVTDGIAEPEPDTDKPRRMGLAEYRESYVAAAKKRVAPAVEEYRVSGRGMKVVAKEYGVSHQTLRKALVEAGVPIHSMATAKARTDSTTLSIVELLKEGRSVREIADQFGVKKDRVYNIRNNIRKGVY